MRTVEADVVIVGAGLAGALAAYKHALAGRRTVVVDRGAVLDHDTVVKVFEDESVIKGKRVEKFSVRVARGLFSHKKKVPVAVGGLARFYAAVSMRMREREFDAWPFSYAELEPYYSEAEHLMKISGNAGTDPCEPPRSRPYVSPLPPVSGFSTQLVKGAQSLGLRPFQHPFAIQFPDCMFCNFCNQVPCPVYAKWSPDRFLHSLAHLPIELHQQVEIEDLRREGPAGDQRVTAATGRDRQTGEAISFRAQQFFLAAGGFFTPVLMQRSGLDEQNELVGSHLMTHCLGMVLGIFRKRITAEGGFNKWFSVSDAYFDDVGNVNGMIQQEHLTTWKGTVAVWPRIVRPIVEAFYYRTCQLLIIGEDEPHRRNHVALDGRGRIVIRKDYSKQDRRRRARLIKLGKRIMKASGAFARLGFNGRSVYHICGTARMGTDPSHSVTDQRGRVWGTKNLYVCDASLFPTSSGVNPSLTIAANSLRVATLARDA